jgi:hypothetical protein
VQRRTRTADCFGINLLFEGKLPHAQLVDPVIVTRNTLLEQAVHLALDFRAFTRELQAPELRHAIRRDEHRRYGLGGDFRDQPSFLFS